MKLTYETNNNTSIDTREYMHKHKYTLIYICF